MRAGKAREVVGASLPEGWRAFKNSEGLTPLASEREPGRKWPRGGGVKAASSVLGWRFF